MKKKSKIISIIVAFVLILSTTCGLLLANANNVSYHSDTEVYFDKEITDNEDGTYTVDLTSFKSTVGTNYDKIDFIVIMDCSKSLSSTEFTNEKNSIKNFYSKIYDTYSKNGTMTFITFTSTVTTVYNRQPLSSLSKSEFNSSVESLVTHLSTLNNNLLGALTAAQTIIGSAPSETLYPVLIVTDGFSGVDMWGQLNFTETTANDCLKVTNQLKKFPNVTLCSLNPNSKGTNKFPMAYYTNGTESQDISAANAFSDETEKNRYLSYAFSGRDITIRPYYKATLLLNMMSSNFGSNVGEFPETSLGWKFTEDKSWWGSYYNYSSSTPFGVDVNDPTTSYYQPISSVTGDYSEAIYSLVKRAIERMDIRSSKYTITDSIPEGFELVPDSPLVVKTLDFTSYNEGIYNFDSSSVNKTASDYFSDNVLTYDEFNISDNIVNIYQKTGSGVTLEYKIRPVDEFLGGTNVDFSVDDTKLYEGSSVLSTIDKDYSFDVNVSTINISFTNPKFYIGQKYTPNSILNNIKACYSGRYTGTSYTLTQSNGKYISDSSNNVRSTLIIPSVSIIGTEHTVANNSDYVIDNCNASAFTVVSSLINSDVNEIRATIKTTNIQPKITLKHITRSEEYIDNIKASDFVVSCSPESAAYGLIPTYTFAYNKSEKTNGRYGVNVTVSTTYLNNINKTVTSSKECNDSKYENISSWKDDSVEGYETVLHISNGEPLSLVFLVEDEDDIIVYNDENCTDILFMDGVKITSIDEYFEDCEIYDVIVDGKYCSFVGWSLTPGGYDAANPLKPDDVTSGTLYANYIYNVDVNYNSDGDTPAEGYSSETYNVSLYVTETQIIKAPTNITVSVNDPTKSGFSFVCWEESNTKASYLNGDTLAIIDDTVFNAKFETGTGSYKVNIYTMNTDGSYGAPVSTTHYGTVGSNVSYTSYVAPKGFYVDSSKSGSCLSGDISIDGSLNINIYLARNAHTFTINYNDGKTANSVSSKLYGETIAVPSINRTGYDFNGWIVNNDSDVSASVPSIMPDEDLTITADYSQLFYTVTWSVNGKETPERYAYGETPTYKGSTDKAADAQYTYTFSSWSPIITPVTKDAVYVAEYSQTLRSYTITWVIGKDEYTETYFYGDLPECKESTDKEATAQYTYTFSSWMPAIEPVDSDAVYTAAYRKTTNEYTITWNVNGNKTSETYKYGEMPVFKGDTSKASDAQYTYSFDNWSPEIVSVSKDAEYSATYSKTLNEYDVTWIVDGVQTKEKYKYGETPSFKGSLNKAADAQYTYIFSNWTPQVTPVECASIYVALFDKTTNKYTITWNVGGNKTVETYDYGSTPSFKGKTDKVADAQYTYAFSGWSPEVVAVVANAEYVAQYNKTTNKYTITWSVNGVETPEEYEYGATPSYKGSTDKAADAQYTYTFKGWTPTIATVTGNATYIAEYDKTLNKYTITWDVNGVETPEEYEYGATPSFKGSTDKAANAQYTYTFKNWSPEISTVTENKKYTAQYDATTNKYTITWSVNGTVTTEDYEYGQTPSFKGSTDKASDSKYTYSFTSFTPEIVAVTEAATYTAQYNSTPNEYTITWKFNNGKADQVDTYNYGEKEIVAPENPGKTGYTFNKWSVEIPEMMPDHNLEISAEYNINSHTITFNTDGGTLIDPIIGNYGSDIEVPENPTKKGHTFLGWDSAIPETMPDEDLVIKALWSINQYTITFDTDGGSEIAPITLNYGEEIAKPNDPSKDGNTFFGWDKTIPETMPDENMTIKALWELNEHTIKFDTDGGTPIEDIVKNYGEEIIKPENPTKEGYKFDSWTVEIPETMPDDDIETKAIWVANKYTVSFNGNGGNGEMASLNAEYGQTFELSENAFDKDLSTFVGWNTKADGTGISYTDKQSVSNLTSVDGETIILYAQWVVFEKTVVASSEQTVPGTILTYTINLTIPEAAETVEIVDTLPDGVMLMDPNPENGSYDGNTITWSYEGPFEAGKQFSISFDVIISNFYNDETRVVVGDKLDNTATALIDDNKFTSNTTSNTIGAYKITYVVDNCEGTAPIDENDYVKDENATVLGNNTFSKSGYHFIGWTDGKGNEYVEKDEIKVEGNTTLTAMWAKVVKTAQVASDPIKPGDEIVYTIAVDVADDISSVTVTDVLNEYLEFVSYTENEHAKFTISEDKKTLTWDVIPTGETINLVFTAKVAKYNYSKDAKLTNVAHVTPSTDYEFESTVSDIDFGHTIAYVSGTETKMDENYYKAGSEAIVLDNTFANTGYTFVAWNTEKDGSGTTYVKNDKIVVNENVTLYAMWGYITKLAEIKDNIVTAGDEITYTIKFASPYDGKSITVEDTLSDKMTLGDITVLPEGAKLETSGNKFTVTLDNAKANEIYEISFKAKIVENISEKETISNTAYADFNGIKIESNTVSFDTEEVIKTYTIKYFANGATGEVTDDNEYLADAVTTILDGSSLVKDGYKFKCWNTKADGTGTSVTVGSKIKVAGDIRLYAIFEEVETQKAKEDNSNSILPKTGSPVITPAIVLMITSCAAVVVCKKKKEDQ